MTWMQSSRVGVRTTAWTSSLSGSRYWSIGRPKAAVLPVPVWAWPITSWPASSSGIACSWIGVGLSKPSSSIACWICGERPRSLKSASLARDPAGACRWCGAAIRSRGRAAASGAGRRRRSSTSSSPRGDAPSSSPIIGASEVAAQQQMDQPEADHRLEPRIRCPVLTSFCSREAIPKMTSRPERGQRRELGVEGVAAAHLEHHVDRLAAVGLEDRVLQVLAAGVDRGVGAEPLDQRPLLLAGREADDLRAGPLARAAPRGCRCRRPRPRSRPSRPARSGRSAGPAPSRSGPGSAAPRPGRRRPRRGSGPASPPARPPSRRRRRCRADRRDPAPVGVRPLNSARESAAAPARPGSRCGWRGYRRS